MKRLYFDVIGNGTASTVSSKLLDENVDYQYVRLTNLHPTSKIFLAFGSQNAELNKGMVLMPLSNIVFDKENCNCNQQMNFIGEAGGEIVAYAAAR